MATKRRPAAETPLSQPLKPKRARPSPPSLLEQFGRPESVAAWKDADSKWERQVAIDIAAQAVEKLALLLDQYGIDRGDDERWFRLALRLAMEHEPGFQIAKPVAPRGRPKSWTDMRRADLYCRVMVENAERELRGLARSDTDVCRLLERDERWKAWGSQKVLYNQLQMAKQSSLVRMIERIKQDPQFG